MNPSRSQCLKWMDEFKLTPKIKRHCIKVSKVATFIAKEFSKKIDVELVERAALLHDLDKIATLKDMKNHGRLTYDFLSAKGFRKLGKVADNAGLIKINKGLKTWEEKIVGYADKRVLEIKVVLLEERLAYMAKRYGTDKTKEGRKAMQNYRKLEKALFSHLSFKPEELKDQK